MNVHIFFMSLSARVFKHYRDLRVKEGQFFSAELDFWSFFLNYSFQKQRRKLAKLKRTKELRYIFLSILFLLVIFNVRIFNTFMVHEIRTSIAFIHGIRSIAFGIRSITFGIRITIIFRRRHTSTKVSTAHHVYHK